MTTNPNAAVLTLPAPGTAGSIAGTKSIAIDTTAPAVTAVTSTTANGSYGVGSVITITVGWSEPVVVTGTPQLALNSGGTASYTSGSGTSTLSFTYTVAAGQNTSKLDYTSTTALTLNGGTIFDTVRPTPTPPFSRCRRRLGRLDRWDQVDRHRHHRAHRHRRDFDHRQRHLRRRLGHHDHRRLERAGRRHRHAATGTELRRHGQLHQRQRHQHPEFHLHRRRRPE